MQIVGFSTAQVATWIYVPAYRLLLDAGDGAAAHLGADCEHIDLVAITHQHRDHLAGLLEVISWAAYERPCRVLYPAESDHVVAVRQAGPTQGVPCAATARWTPVRPGQRIPLTDKESRPHLLVLPATHAVRKTYNRALGYAIVDNDAVPLAVTGDSAVAPLELPAPPEILFCDCTYLCRQDVLEPYAGLSQHGLLDRVLTNAVQVRPGHLVLYHLNARYNADDHAELVRHACRTHEVTFPVTVLWPGAVCRDVLAAGRCSPAAD